MESLYPSISKTLLDAVASATGNSDPVALPALSSSIQWQTSFGSDPDAISIQILGSLDNISYSVLDSSTSVTGESKNLITSSIFIKARINSITNGDEITVQVVAKPYTTQTVNQYSFGSFDAGSIPFADAMGVLTESAGFFRVEAGAATPSPFDAFFTTAVNYISSSQAADGTGTGFGVLFAPAADDANPIGVMYAVSTSGSKTLAFPTLTAFRGEIKNDVTGYVIGLDKDWDIYSHVAEFDGEDHGVSLRGTGLLDAYYGRFDYINLAVAGGSVGDIWMNYIQAPFVDPGASITGHWIGLWIDDVSTLTAGGAIQPINYADKFIVGKDGSVTASDFNGNSLLVFPDSDPHVAGAGYWTAGVLTKSAG